MAEDWQAGDLARCVDVRDIRLPMRTAVHRGGDFLRQGMIYVVQGTSDVFGTDLALDVGAPHGPKLACRFVKVPPLSPEEHHAAIVELANDERVPA